MSNTIASSDAARVSTSKPVLPALFADHESNQRWIVYVTWVFIFIGIVLRLERYLLCFPLWLDELSLTEGLLSWRSLASVWDPLPNCQVAPPLFLCIEWLLVQAFGYSEYVLRAFPLLMGIAGIFLLWQTMKIAFGDFVAMIATGVFAVSESVMDHVSEVKPYSTDVAVSLVFLLLAVYALKRTSETRWWWALGAFTPLGLSISFPSIFTIAGISLALFFPAWHRGWRFRSVHAFNNLVLVSVFAFLFVTVIQTQETATRGGMQSYWQTGFLPLEQPLQIPLWLADAFTGDLMAYPIGDDYGRSLITLLACLVGAYCLYTRRSTVWLAVFLLPLLLALIASALKRYPFGPSVRVTLYLAPIIIGLSAIGFSQSLIYFQQRFKSTRPIYVALVFLLLIGAGGWINNLVQPLRVNREWQYQAFVRWFWNAPEDEIMVCAITDLGASIPAPPIWYRTCQRIYSPRHREGRQQLDLDNIKTDQRVKIVVPRGQPYLDRRELWREVRSKLPSNFRLEHIDNHVVKSRMSTASIDVYEMTCVGTKNQPGQRNASSNSTQWR